MVKFTKIRKIYTNGVNALYNINLHIKEQEFVYIIGPTGSGKSTLIKLLDGEEIPTSGRVEVAGINVGIIKHNKIAFYRRNIGVVFQDFRLLERKTVFENIAYALEVIDVPERIIIKRVNAVMELVGITDKKYSFPDELSGGQQQRVAIARAIANKPCVLIADEPTGNLDPQKADEIMNLLDKINQEEGTTIIMVTHAQHIVEKFRKRTIVLEDGHVVADNQMGGYVRRD